MEPPTQKQIEALDLLAIPARHPQMPHTQTCHACNCSLITFSFQFILSCKELQKNQEEQAKSLSNIFTVPLFTDS
jgi:hypothetical protein